MTFEKDRPLVIHLAKLPVRMQKILRMDQLDEADRASILDRLEARNFEKIVMTGPL
jgi:hypothetical protein